MRQALEGITILELAVWVAAPGGTMLLSDMGAEVIKVEPFPIGDDARRQSTNDFYKEDSRFWQAMSRNKRSIMVDFTKPEGLEIVQRLAKRSDVLLEGFTPGIADKLGVGYEQIAKINPRLIYASVSAFGPTGPYGQRPGFDIIVQGLVGTMSMLSVDGYPVTLPIMVGDASTPMLVALGIMLGLFVRERTGLAQKVETSVLSGAMTMLATRLVRAKNDPTPPLPMVGRGNATYRSFLTQDGQYIAVGVLGDRQWKKLCELTDLEHLLEDPRFKSLQQRMRAGETLGPLFDGIFQTKTKAEWMKLLDEAGLPCGAINTVEDVFDEPQARQNGLIVELEHPALGKIETLGVPIKLSKTPGKIRRTAPLLGQDTDEIMESIGYSKEQIAELREKRIVG